MDENPVLVEKRDGYRVITLNRPQRLNAFNEPMQQALVAAVAEAETDENCRALLLTGTGPRVLLRPGPERADQCRGRSDRAGRGAGAVLQSAGPQTSRAALPGGLRRQRHRGRRLLQHRARLRHRAGGALGDVPSAVREAGHRSRWRRHLAVAAAGRPGAGARAGAAGRAAVGGKGGAMGPDLEGGRRRKPDGGSRKALRAFLDRADVRPGPDQARARCRRGQRPVGAARPRTQSAARGRLASELPRRRAGVPAEAKAELSRGKR